MAYEHTKLGGNLNANAKQSTMFIYFTDVDDLATVSAVDYFLEANGSAPTPQPPGFQGNADNILYDRDFILISATDGFAVGRVEPDGSTVVLVESEV